jgi:hypothetical protein
MIEFFRHIAESPVFTIFASEDDGIDTLDFDD